jgi:hypothetical protein
MSDATTEAGGRADRRLREEEVAWLTTVRSDGQPQSVPIWFLWDGETFLIYSQPGRQKLKNITRNPRTEGTAEIVEDFPQRRMSASTGEIPGRHCPDRLRPRRLRAGLLRADPGDPRALAGLVERVP